MKLGGGRVRQERGLCSPAWAQGAQQSTHPQSLLQRDLVCARSHSGSSKHPTANPPWFLFALVRSDSLPVKALYYTSPKLTSICRLVDFGACKARLQLCHAFSSLSAWWQEAVHTHSCITRPKCLFLDRSYSYWWIIHFMQVKKVTLQTAVIAT